MDRVVIVGASAAGLAVAQTLREMGFDRSITVVGDEARAFYDRPPLSKASIAGEEDLARHALITATDLDALGIWLRLGVAAAGVDPRGRTVQLADGAELPFDRLVIATGVTPRRLPGGGLVVRGFDDALAVNAALATAERVLVVGAGVLGCELAALAAGMGRKTLMIDPLAAPMVDRVGPLVARRLGRLHAEHGVDALFDVRVDRILDGGRGARLVDGRVLEADAVLVAIGARPAVGWLEGSGVPLGDGVLCDNRCVAAPGIYAAGDVCNWFNPRFGRRMRIEHRMNATEQGMSVAANLLGADEPFAPIPFFWTDQHGVKIQVHGTIDGAAETVVLSGDPESDAFVVGYRRADGVVDGVLAWNMPREARKARAMVSRALV